MKTKAQIATCYATLRDSILTIGNEVLQVAYDLSGGRPRLSAYQLTGHPSVAFEHAPAELQMAPNMARVSHYVLETTTKTVFPGENEFLEVRLHFKLGPLEAKRVWAIYPDVPALSTQYFFRGKVQENWFAHVASTPSNAMIEDAVALTTGEDLSYYGTLPLNGPHWKTRVIAFKDATDNTNNLVEETYMIPYVKPTFCRGNLLLLQNMWNDSGIFILKQSPLSHSQQSYPGHDFVIDQRKVLITGNGLSKKDIDADEWVSTYSYVLGFSDSSELQQLSTLRRWQKQLRRLKPERDEMILSNTWGDRNKDAKMNEEFILKELEAAAKLGITHFQLDDGWQEGLSRNSAEKQGKRWSNWTAEDWQPSEKRFPNGLDPIVKKAAELGIGLGLWFNPGSGNNYRDWKMSADVLVDYYEKFGIRVFKIDGVDLANKESEDNLQKLLQHVSVLTKGEVTFNLDVTAGRRGGYHFLSTYGNIFLENRYTDWGNYYPYQTLRNLWSLAAYIPLEKIQAEWLNSWRNRDKYPSSDPLAPAAMPWDYLMATTWAAQPLAWMEVSALPEEAFKHTQTLKAYQKIQHRLHRGILLPIGNEPDGRSWTGFQSIDGNKGFLLVFREKTTSAKGMLRTHLPKGKRVRLTPIAGQGKPFKIRVDAASNITFELPSPFSYALYEYEIY